MVALAMQTSLSRSGNRSPPYAGQPCCRKIWRLRQPTRAAARPLVVARRGAWGGAVKRKLFPTVSGLASPGGKAGANPGRGYINTREVPRGQTGAIALYFLIIRHLPLKGPPGYRLSCARVSGPRKVQGSFWIDVLTPMLICSAIPLSGL